MERISLLISNRIPSFDIIKEKTSEIVMSKVFFQSFCGFPTVSKIEDELEIEVDANLKFYVRRR